MLDEALLSYALKHDDGLRRLQRVGIEISHFVPEYQPVWRYILRMRRQHNTIPSPDVVLIRFPELSLPDVRKKDMPVLLHDLRQRKRWMDAVSAANEFVDQMGDYEKVDEAIQSLQARLNGISYRGKPGHLVDLFDPKTSAKMAREIQKRRSGQIVGIPTGLERFDRRVGGLQRQRMVTVMGRPGKGKSWLDLLFVTMAVIAGEKVILYPLEMTLQETAFRLYTIFTQRVFGANRVLRNYDLSQGRISTRKLMRFLHALEDRFQGQLYVADVGTLADPYTVERIEAEVETHRPGMFWVDYIQLLKPPPSGDDQYGAQGIRALSSGIKRIAMACRTVGGVSVQVNREAIRSGAFLPRLEHIYGGDAIGMDTDLAFTLNRIRDYLYYALVKNRGGLEIGKTKVRFFVDEGKISEVSNQEEESDGDG